ncbi:MAG TPA: YaeQ family protein, partial [Pseudomonadales bacterium]|nr:YaeQ family protein [Pseudomonadales bacterium]
WIELGQPDEKRIRRACGRARHVIIYTYSPRAAAIWWQQIRSGLTRFDNLTIKHIAGDSVDALAKLAARTMDLQFTIQDGQVWVSDSANNILIEFIQFPD